MTSARSWVDRTEARVYVWSEPSINEAEVLRFLGDQALEWHRTPKATQPDELVEMAGRICYMSFGNAQSERTNPEYVANLITKGHESVLEHATWTLAITGVSRAFTHQLVRHRAGFSYSQLSQQYHDEGSQATIQPLDLTEHPELAEVWRGAVEQSREAYVRLVDALVAEAQGSDGDPREALRRARSTARSVLPEATQTSIVVTANARSWRHFLNIRGAIVGDHEMRIVSALILQALSKSTSALFADFAIAELRDGLPIVQRSAPP